MNENDIVFRAELKALILAAVEKDEPEDGLRDDEPWFGDDSRLGLDSRDTLHISGDPEAIRRAHAGQQGDAQGAGLAAGTGRASAPAAAGMKPANLCGSDRRKMSNFSDSFR